jgi:hypothetical protein
MKFSYDASLILLIFLVATFRTIVRASTTADPTSTVNQELTRNRITSQLQERGSVWIEIVGFIDNLGDRQWIDVCQGTDAVGAYYGGGFCTVTLVHDSTTWGQRAEMLMYDQWCNTIGENDYVTLDQLAAGWGFSSQLPDFVVLTIPDVGNPFDNQISFWYNSVYYQPFQDIPAKASWFMEYNYTAFGGAGSVGAFRMGFGC